MATINRRLAAVALGLAVAAAATPSFAQRAEQQQMNPARERAIHDCSMDAAKMRQYTWGDTEITTYRTCMNQHGMQQE